MFDGSIQTDGFIYVGSYTTGTTGWTDKCVIGPAGDMAAVGTITGGSLSIIGQSTSSILTPTVAGVHINNYGGYAFIDLAGSSTGGGYLDFGTNGVYYKGRMVYRTASNQFEWYINSSGSINMALAAGGLYAGGTLVSASDTRLNFNEKPLVNALDMIRKLKPVEYDQTFVLVDKYTQETPQSHQAGFIAQDVQNIDELKLAVQGGIIGEDGKESVRALNYNVVFRYAVNAIQ